MTKTKTKTTTKAATPKVEFGCNVEETLAKWARSGARVYELTAEEYLVLKKHSGIDTKGLSDGEETVRAQHRDLVVRKAASGEKIPQAVIDSHPGIEEEIEKMKKAASKGKKKRQPKVRDRFGGGRVKPGDHLERKFRRIFCEVEVKEDHFLYRVERSGEWKRADQLSDVVNAVWPRDKIPHHESGWSVFGLMPSQIARREEAERAKAEAEAEKPKAAPKATRKPKPKPKAAPKATRKPKPKVKAAPKRKTTRKRKAASKS